MKKNMTKTSILAACIACSFIYAGQSCNDYLLPTSALAQFKFNGGGSHVTDKRTGLMWKRCQEGQRFSDSGTPDVFNDDSCQGVATYHAREDALRLFSRQSDYRMPNIKELESIAELKCVSPAINLVAFPNQANNWVWSATYIKPDSTSEKTNALSMNFETGVVGFNGSGNATLRLIRYRNLIVS